MKKVLRDELGVEPLAMKIFAGIVLLVIGLGIGYGVYTWAGGWATAIKCNLGLEKNTTTIGIPDNGENTNNIRVDISIAIGTAENVTLDATGKPQGVSVTFNPPRSEPPFYSYMTVKVDNTATAGNYVLTILAKDSKGATSGSAPFNLTIIAQ